MAGKQVVGMIVYEPADCTLSQNELHLFALEAARKVVPGAKFLSSKLSIQSVTLPLLDASHLALFAFYRGNLEARDWDAILEGVAEFRSQNEKLLKVPMGQTSFYISGHEFSPCFLKEIGASQFEIRLFTWALIRSKDHQALLLRKFQENFDPAPEEDELDFDVNLSGNRIRNVFCLDELSTAELIELTRLGMNIRARR